MRTEVCVRHMLPIDNEVLLLGQDYGCIDLVRVSDLKILASEQLASQGGIKEIMKTSRKNEYAFATMHGLMFARVFKDEKGQYKFQQLEDSYLKGMYIRSAIEYQPDKYIVCINENNYIYLVVRKTKECNYSIENPSGQDKILAVKRMPGFDIKNFPYLVLRD